MADQLSPDDVAAAIADARRSSQTLLEGLSSDPTQAVAVLRSLQKNPDATVRSWVPWAAPRVLPKEAALVLMHMSARDRDPDVRDAALEELVDLDPVEVKRYAGELRKRLRSADLYEPVGAMWTLATIRDMDALPEIERLATTATRPWHRLAAEVVSLFLRGAHREILDRIRGHDHDSMPWLAGAARLIGSDDARAVLEHGARSAPDEDCRGFCMSELQLWRARSS